MNRTASVIVALLAGASQSFAAEMGRTWLAADYLGHQIAIYREGQGITWKHQAKGVYDVCARANGNIIWADYAGVHEIAPDREKGEGGKLLWEYRCGSAPPRFAGKAEVHSCQVQPDGLIVTAEAGSQRLVFLDPNGTVVRTVPVASGEKSGHHQFRLVRRSAAGTQWVACLAEAIAKEVTDDGTGQRTLVVPTDRRSDCRLYEALPLPDGNLLMSTAALARVIECDPAGKVVWEFDNQKAKALGFQMKWLSGISRLANGNTIVCDWLGTTHKAFEVTPEGKVVWVMDPTVFKGLTGLQPLGDAWPASDRAAADPGQGPAESTRRGDTVEKGAQHAGQ